MGQGTIFNGIRSPLQGGLGTTRVPTQDHKGTQGYNRGRGTTIGALKNYNWGPETTTGTGNLNWAWEPQWVPGTTRGPGDHNGALDHNGNV